MERRRRSNPRRPPHPTDQPTATVTHIMGKQSKRKHHKSKRRTPSLAADAANPTGRAEHPIVSKIRHGDPRIRHAALMALSATVYDSTVLTNNARGAIHPSDPALLRALSERLLDPDVPCAILAAGCLSNHVSFASPADAAGDEEWQMLASQVTIPILLQRISLGCDACAVWKTDKRCYASAEEQWTLQSLSVQTLAGLIENCPSVVHRMSESALPSLLRVVRCGMDFIQSDLIIADQNHPVLDAASNTARALHSLLDENVDLIETLIQQAVGSSSTQKTALPDVPTVVNELTALISNAKLTNTARLHACGAILSLRKVLVDNDDSSGARTRQLLQSCTNTLILPTLNSIFSVDLSSNEIGSPKYVLHRMISLQKLLLSQKQDEAMEAQITNEINARKEPARLIARRQKEMKIIKKEQEEKVVRAAQDVEMSEETAKEGVSMIEDDVVSTNVEGNDDASSDPNDQFETILQSWRELCGSHKLALELMANLCSGPNEDDEEADNMSMYNEENDHMWDSDDEAKLMEGVTNSSNIKLTNPMDGEVYASIASHRMIEQILMFFRSWLLFVPSLTLEEGFKCPNLVEEDVEELLSTCTLSLGNAMACDIPTWSSPAAKEVVSAICPGAVVDDGTSLFWWALVSLLKTTELSSSNQNDVINHVTTIMLSLLRHQTKSRVLADAPTLDLLFHLLLSQADIIDSDNVTSSTQMQCNIIAMLGLLCSEPHPASVNARVCASLVEKMNNQSNTPKTAKQAVLVLNEVYNVVMDIYGGDDANNQVYQEQDVSGHLIRTLPAFKKNIKQITSVERDNEELFVWNETALNVSRFIKFKRGG